MAIDKALAWTYAEEFAEEGSVLQAARARGEELGCPSVSPGTGAAIRAFAAACGARTVAEVGTGVGVSGLWLLEGMHPDGVLTTIDSEAEFHKAARRAFQAAGAGAPRTRLITGRALDVLPRMAARAYDLVMVHGAPQECHEYLEHAQRMLRPGGLVLIAAALWADKVADPARRDPDTVAMRELVRELAASEAFVPALLPCGDGLLVGVRS